MPQFRTNKKTKKVYPIKAKPKDNIRQDYKNVMITIRELPGLIPKERKVLSQCNWQHHKGYHWSVGRGDTKYVADTLNLSRKKADVLIMKVLNKLDRKYDY